MKPITEAQVKAVARVLAQDAGSDPDVELGFNREDLADWPSHPDAGKFRAPLWKARFVGSAKRVLFAAWKADLPDGAKEMDGSWWIVNERDELEVLDAGVVE